MARKKGVAEEEQEEEEEEADAAAEGGGGAACRGAILPLAPRAIEETWGVWGKMWAEGIIQDWARGAGSLSLDTARAARRAARSLSPFRFRGNSPSTSGTLVGHGQRAQTRS